MALEEPRQRELAQLMPDHVFRDIDRHMAAAIMHADRVADHLREDGGVTRPGLEYPLGAGAVHRLHPREQALVYVWTLFGRTAHSLVIPQLSAFGFALSAIRFPLSA